MKKIRNFTIASLSIFLLTQCASQDEVRELNYQLRAVNQKVDEVKTTTVDQMQKRQANSVNKIDQVEGEAMKLKALIEENAHQSSLYREQGKEDIATLQAIIESMKQENTTQLTQMNQKINVLEQQLRIVSSGMEKQQQQRVRDAEKRAREAAMRAEAAKRQSIIAATATAAPSVGTMVRVLPSGKKVKLSSARVVDNVSTSTASSSASSAPKAKSNVETVKTPDVTSAPFDKAFGQYQAKKYQEAYRQFEQVLAGNPQGTRAAETLFYMGECLFYQGEYDLAILDYQKVISNHSRDALAPKALLKQGMSFEELTDIETAKIIYKKLIAEFSSSSEAKQAKSKLSSL